MPKLATVATHPIQYQVPLWKDLTQRGVDLRVYYATRHGLDVTLDREFGEAFRWDVPMLDGYAYEFCSSVAVPGVGGPVQNMWPRGLWAAFARERFDAVLVHGYATGAAWAALTAAWGTGTPVIIRGDSHDVGRSREGVRQRAKHFALSKILARVEAALAVGTWNREYWESYGMSPDRVETSLYSVDNERFRGAAMEGAARAAALRTKWTSKRDETVFIYCAKLIPKKSPELLLQAFSRLDNDTRLVMVGSGEMGPALQRDFAYLGDRVIWVGFVNQAEIPIYYAASDVMVLPSQFEPWGLVVNEAMACGLPCIVSDVVAAGEDLVRRPGTGAVFRHGDVDALEAALRLATQADQLRAWKAKVPATIDRAHNRYVVDAIIRAAHRARS